MSRVRDKQGPGGLLGAVSDDLTPQFGSNLDGLGQPISNMPWREHDFGTTGGTLTIDWRVAQRYNLLQNAATTFQFNPHPPVGKSIDIIINVCPNGDTIDFVADDTITTRPIRANQGLKPVIGAGVGAFLCRWSGAANAWHIMPIFNAGNPAPFDPATLSDLWGWWRGDVANVGNNWPARPLGIVAGQNFTSFGTTMSQNLVDPNFNNQPSIRWLSGGAGAFTRSPIMSSFTNALQITIFYLGKLDQAPPSVFGTFYGNNNDDFAYRSDAGGVNTNMNNRAVPGFATWDNNVHFIAFRITNGVRNWVRFDNNEDNTVAVGQTNFNAGGSNIDGLRASNNVSTGGQSVDIADMIVYSRDMSDAEIAQVVSYFNSRYNLGLT